MSAIRVVVAEDSPTVRRYLCAVLAREPDIVVAGEAADGGDVLGLVQRLRPDVLTLDILMPGLDGVAVAERVMATCPTPILVVSSTTSSAEAWRSFDVLRAGAVEVQDKPGLHDDAAWEERFLRNVRMVARIKVITHVRAALELRRRSSAPAPLPAPLPAPPPAPWAARRRSRPMPSTAPAGSAPSQPALRRRLLAIGASTGGPRAISTIICALPPSFPLPILIVLHINEGFEPGWRDWLATQCRLPVAIAADGEPLPPVGRPSVLLAPAGRHLVLERDLLRLDSGPERNSCRPSVDVLFESLVPQAPSTIACLLTGMGKDGAVGLAALRRAGAYTVAQDEASSVVYGMPQEAMRLGAVDEQLPIGLIAGRLATLAMQ